MPATTRRQITAPPSRLFKLRLHPKQVLTLHVLHELLLDDLLRNCATEATLWELVAMAFTWSRTAELLGEGEPEIAPMLELATRLVERWGATGQVQLIGVERQVACHGIIVMDLLAQRTDSETATAASHWSEGCLTVLRGAPRRPATAAAHAA